MGAPVFYYDFNSPYAYLAAARVQALLGESVRWQPVAFAFIFQAAGRVPWSLQSEEGRKAGMAECEARAEAYRLQPLRWPPGWPVGSYSLIGLRGALAAEELGKLEEFSWAAFLRHFAEGRSLLSSEDVAEVARVAGIGQPALLCARGEGRGIRDRLRQVTEAAIAAGVPGVPTVEVAGQMFWGDDRLPDAAAALGAAQEGG